MVSCVFFVFSMQKSLSCKMFCTLPTPCTCTKFSSDINYLLSTYTCVPSAHIYHKPVKIIITILVLITLRQWFVIDNHTYPHQALCVNSATGRTKPEPMVQSRPGINRYEVTFDNLEHDTSYITNIAFEKEGRVISSSQSLCRPSNIF